MKGVDRADQYLSYYSSVLRTKKWTVLFLTLSEFLKIMSLNHRIRANNNLILILINMQPRNRKFFRRNTRMWSKSFEKYII